MSDRDNTSPASWIATATADLLGGVHQWRLWTMFAWHDTVSRFRRSWIGPLWLVLTAAIFISALSLVYSTLLQVDIRGFVPFVAVGVVAWGFVSSVASEAATTFVEAETYIRQVRVNLFVYVLRVVWRNVLVFAHQFAVVLLVLGFFGKLELHLLPLAALGLFLFFLQAVWVIPLLGLLGARFRDLQPIVTNLLQILFFITPVIWLPGLLRSRRWIADLNPLHSLIAVMREPLLGNIPTAANYAVVAVMTVAGFTAALLFYGRFRARIVYWL